MKWLLIIMMLAPAVGFGQTARRGAAPAPKKADAPTKWPIERLAVEGNHRYTAGQVLAVAGLKIGQLAGKNEFDAARDRLVASGAFETVGYKFEPGPNNEGYVATFQVVEVEPAYPVRFEMLGVPTAELEADLRSKDPLFSMTRLPATQLTLDRYVGWIHEYLTTKGNPEKLIARLNPVGTGEFEIVFRPARSYPAVAEVSFEGNKDLPQNVLQDAVAGVAIGQPYTEEHFRALLNTGVRPYYEAHGHMRVKFGQIRTQPVSDVKGLHVFVTVEEGPVYQLAQVSIAQPSPVRPDILLKDAAIKTGEIANFDKVNEGGERIRKAVVRAGYLDVQVTPERTIDDARHTVSVAMRIDPGPRFTMGKLTVKGLDLDGEAEIRRIWTIQPGQPFNPDYPQIFLNSVRQQGLFDNLGDTKADVQRNDKDHTEDVTLTFTSDKPKKKTDGLGGPLPPG
jgi:outer membrane protein insertion porin family